MTRITSRARWTDICSRVGSSVAECEPVPSESEIRATAAGGRAPAASRCAMRVLRNGSETVLVYQPETGDSAALVFESTGTSVSLDKFPADWRRLSDPELLRLRKSV